MKIIHLVPFLMILLLLTGVNSALASQQSWAIRGKAVTIDGVKNGWLVIEDGVIKKVGAKADELPDGIKKIKWNHYIFPGLIDTHNHVKWNSIPQWSVGPYANRYEWLERNLDYRGEVQAPYYALQEHTLKETSQKYGEVRAIIGGTTLIQGSYYELQPNFLCRNLDERYKALNQVTSLMKEKPERLKLLSDGLDRGKFNRVFIHLAEGLPTDSTTKGEFQNLKEKELDKDGVVIIHGLGLKEKDFKHMSKKNMHLVWSPVSNWNLYRGIADIKSALKSGLVVSLAPDWTISGSDNVLEEMKFAYAIGKAKWGNLITPKLIFEMTTTNAARVSGVDKETMKNGIPLGQIAPGYAADLILAPKLDAVLTSYDIDSAKPIENTPSKEDDPYESLLRTYPKHIHLVFINGYPVYGDRSTMKELVKSIDKISVQNTPKAIARERTYNENESNHERYREIEEKLEDVLPELAPLVEN